MNGQAPAEAALPAPTGPRWQPLRAGLVDLFFYDAEEFWFRDGRLLLRGNNGTGKSKVLALLLPFLLDGEVAPHRVEPDGDRAKRMEWNLLLDGRYSERTGYTWLELGRATPDGPQYLTLGCGLKAVAGKGAPARWLFATGQRVGVDLWLVTDTGTAKTKDRLADALDATGQMTEQPGTWRRIVDERLFGLGESRYDALLRLLIALRQPQLSRRPDEAALSAALTDALAPPAADVLHDVATAFRELEAERAALAGLAEARDEVADFAGRYAHTAAVATRRAAAGVRGAQSAYERVRREQSGVDDALSAARAAERQAQAATDAADDAVRRGVARQTALRDSEVMADARSLEREEEVARDHEVAADRSSAHLRDAVSRQETAQTELAAAEVEQTAAAVALTAAESDAAHTADEAGLTVEHHRIVTLDLDAAPRESGAVAERRSAAVTHVRGLGRLADEAADEEIRARRRRDDAAAERDRAADAEVAQRAKVADAGSRLVAAVRAWAGGLTELRLDGEELEGRVGDWIVNGEGEEPVGPTLRDAGARAGAALAGAGVELRARRQALTAERAALDDERRQLATGAPITPPPSPTRDADGRRDRPGAPLWQLVDFQPGVRPEDRAGLEAALEASGLLDAWVTPDGALLDPSTLDTVVVATTPAEPSLAGVLRPAVDAGDTAAARVGTDTVAAVLGSVGLGPASARTWISVDGRYRVGPLEGAWRVPAARYIGHAAREQARRARLDVLRTALSELDAALGGIDDELAVLQRRRQRLDEEIAAAPSGREVLDAHAVLVERQAAVERALRELSSRDDAVAAAAEAADAARRARDDAAADLRLPTDPDGLERVGVAVAAYRTACAHLWPARRRRHQAQDSVARLRRRLEQAATDVARADTEATTDRGRAVEARTRVETLRERVGGAVAELHAELAAVARAIEAAEHRRAAAAQERSARHDDVTRLVERGRGLAEQAATATERRQAATDDFAHFAATGLVTAAVPGAELPADGWAPDPTVRLCRRLEAELADVDASDDAWQRVDTRLVERFGQLAEVLSRHGHHAELRREADAPVVALTFRSQQLTPAALLDRLERDLIDRQQLLSHRERELLEAHLVAEVAAHLSERLAAADAQVAAINAELAQRPTSTGMVLALRWRPRSDAPAGLAEARRRLLRQRAEAWSADDRQAVGAFLDAQINAVQARSEGGTWMEHLSEAFDYRQWHEFVVERRRDGRWTRALGPASGGERALSMTVPMLAAAASFYDTATLPGAPRPIMLDEAFAGIDDDARAKCFGLLAEFDLDVVLTSEREWGCHPTVPGLAIAQLARVDGIDAVHVSRWEWDGQRVDEVDPAVPPAREPAAAGAPQLHLTDDES